MATTNIKWDIVEPDTIEPLFNRLIYLYYLGIPVQSPIPEIFKCFDDYFESLRIVTLRDINNKEKICGVHRDGDVLFVIGKKPYYIITSSNEFALFFDEVCEKFPDINMNGIAMIEARVLSRKNLKWSGVSPGVDNIVQYFEHLKSESLKV